MSDVFEPPAADGRVDAPVPAGSRRPRRKQAAIGLAVVVLGGTTAGGGYLLTRDSGPNFCERAAALPSVALGDGTAPPIAALRASATAYHGLAEAGGSTEEAAVLIGDYFDDLADAAAADAASVPGDRLHTREVIGRAAKDPAVATANTTLTDAIAACTATDDP